VTYLSDKGYINLGSDGLRLNIITPLQKGKGGTNIGDVIGQRFFDLYGLELDKTTLKVTEELFATRRKVRMRNINYILYFII